MRYKTISNHMFNILFPSFNHLTLYRCDILCCVKLSIQKICDVFLTLIL